MGEVFVGMEGPFPIKLPGNGTLQVISEINTHNTYILYITYKYKQYTKRSNSGKSPLMNSKLLLGFYHKLQSPMFLKFREAEAELLFCFPCTEWERESSLRSSWQFLR